MAASRLWILYEPQIYADLLIRVLELPGVTEVVEPCQDEYPLSFGKHEDCADVDIVLLPLDECGQPKVSLLPEEMPTATLIAFSPDGDLGMRLQPGTQTWEIIRPFELIHLLLEILDTRKQPQQNTLPQSKRH
jgi:hypothetical protein